MPPAPRSAADILADLQALDRENDRLELQAAVIRQNLKAAEARITERRIGESTLLYMERAEKQIRKAG